MKPVPIGLLLGDLGKLNTVALKYLFVHLNTIQGAFEFEVLPTPPDVVITQLSSKMPIDRSAVRNHLSAFGKRMTQEFLPRLIEQYNLAQRTIPDSFIIITMAKFTDNWYSVAVPGIRVLALGNWDSYVAPPSLLEAIIILTLRHAVALVSPSLSVGVHLGTKGCLFDFTASLNEAKFKTLQGFICSQCRDALTADGHEPFIKEVAFASDTCKWLGRSEDITSPAGIVAKLGHDMFLTRGVSPTLQDRVRAALRDEAVKEFIKFGYAILLAGLLAWIGWAKG